MKGDSESEERGMSLSLEIICSILLADLKVVMKI